jgi:hypothetical protein
VGLETVHRSGGVYNRIHRRICNRSDKMKDGVKEMCIRTWWDDEEEVTTLPACTSEVCAHKGPQFAATTRLPDLGSLTSALTVRTDLKLGHPNRRAAINLRVTDSNPLFTISNSNKCAVGITCNSSLPLLLYSKPKVTAPLQARNFVLKNDLRRAVLIRQILVSLDSARNSLRARSHSNEMESAEYGNVNGRL